MKYYKYSLNMKVLNIFSICLFIPFYIIILGLGYNEFINFNTLVLYFLWMFLHEFLHGVGFSLSPSIDYKKIVYGANLEKGIFYCMCKDLISKKNIMISLMFPFFFIGVVTLVIGFIFNVPILIILSLFNIAGCAGDIAMFLSFLRLPSFSYIDLDDCTGYVLVSEYDLSNYRLFGMNLVESGKYNDSMRTKDFRKFTISKLSYVVFLIVIILFVFFNFM